MHWQKLKLPLAFTTFSLGLLVSVQLNTQEAALRDYTAQSQENLATVIKTLNEKREALLQEKWELENRLRLIKSDPTQGQRLLSALREETNRLRAAGALAPLRGPGITITVSSQTPIGYDDLIRIINELWNVGSEGIAINGIRLTQYTAITQSASGNTIVGSQTITYPYVIQAIGDSASLTAGINILGGTLDQLINVNGVKIEVKTSQDLLLPAGQAPTAFKYARVPD